jgi:hypothetical protein
MTTSEFLRTFLNFATNLAKSVLHCFVIAFLWLGHAFGHGQKKSCAKVIPPRVTDGFNELVALDVTNDVMLAAFAAKSNLEKCSIAIGSAIQSYASLRCFGGIG